MGFFSYSLGIIGIILYNIFVNKERYESLVIEMIKKVGPFLMGGF